jgi:hypothetical protein
MSVVQKDRVVHGMLQDELERCEGLSKSLDAAISHLPKGSLHVRKIPSGKKCLQYYYLKFRDGHKSVYKHVPKGLQPELSAGIEERRKLQGQLHQLNARIRYLRKLLKTGADK